MVSQTLNSTLNIKWMENSDQLILPWYDFCRIAMRCAVLCCAVLCERAGERARKRARENVQKKVIRLFVVLIVRSTHRNHRIHRIRRPEWMSDCRIRSCSCICRWYTVWGMGAFVLVEMADNGWWMMDGEWWIKVQRYFFFFLNIIRTDFRVSFNWVTISGREWVIWEQGFEML